MPERYNRTLAMTKPTDEMLLCAKCVDATRFTKWIRANGQPGQCDFDAGHGNRGHVVTVEDFSAHVDEFFREHYQPGAEERYFDDSDRSYHQQRGTDLDDILRQKLGTDDDAILKAIMENLPDASDRDIAQGAEPFYDDTINYESIADVHERNRADSEDYWYQNRFSYLWQDFCSEVQYGHRFFTARRLLDKLFGKPPEYESGKLNPVYMLRAPQTVFRARILNSSFTEQELMLNPARELGTPPKERAPAGRMNVEYIPAFYGAFGELVAVAELRPGIGEEVAIGEFVLQRDVKVFDFTVFSRTPHERWSESYAHTRYDFIQQMEEEISRRALPDEKQRHYIPTQIVAEYLQVHFGCKAVIYRSAVVSRGASESRNIVFLPQADSYTEGPSPLLKHTGCVVKEVDDVSYTLVKCPF